MRILHFIPERMLVAADTETPQRSTDISPAYLSVITTGMAEKANVQVAKTFAQLKQLAKEKKPDIIHIHGCWNLSAYQVQHWATHRRYAVVLSLHNDMQPWRIRRHFWLHKLPLLILYQRQAIKSADAIHVFSHSEYQRMERMKWNSRMALIKNSTISDIVSDEQMTDEWMAFYQKVIDSNSFRLMTDEDKVLENEMLHCAITNNTVTTPSDIPADSLRKILIHASDEGILDAVKKGAVLMQQKSDGLVIDTIERFPQRLKKETGPLENEKILPKSRLTKTKFHNLLQDEKPSETEQQLIVMLINIQHELKHRRLSRRHLMEFYQTLRFTEYDEDKFQRMTKQLKIQKFAARLMQILHETFYLEEGFMPISPVDDKRTNKLRKSLLQSNTQ
jgi:hypothetical protein